MPPDDTALPKTERGYSFQGASNRGFWAPVDDQEETPELLWPMSVQVFDRMRRQDAQCMSVLRAVTLPLRRTPWRLDPNGARDEVAQLCAEDLGLPLVGLDRQETPGPRTADRFSWPEHLRLALLMLPQGHSFFEQVYRIDPQGRARLRKLGWRPSRTISRLDVAADGGLTAIYQAAPLEAGRTGEVRIGVERLVAYCNDREGGNWLGSSLLRPAYKFWLLKDRALRGWAQTLDRNGQGIPIYKSSPQPDTVTGQDRINREQAEIDAGNQLAQAYRGGDNAGAALPNGAELILRGVEGTLPDHERPIRYYDEQIARAVLAHFLNLGTETGSWALGSTFADFFTLSLQTIANQVADVATQHVVEDLVDANWGSKEPAPRVVFDEIGSRHPATAEAIRALLQCGALTPDDELESHLRTTYGLPAADPATRREVPGQANTSPTQEAA
jgi:hypothetical protein